jgi:Notch-like protein
MFFSHQGFSGNICQYPHAQCSSSPCLNGATCEPTSTGFICRCIPGSTGDVCEFDTVNECDSSPCQHGGTCIDAVGGYECSCPVLWNGIDCETFDDNFPGGIGRPVVIVPTVTVATVADCIANGCREKAGDGKCDVSIFAGRHCCFKNEQIIEIVLDCCEVKR